MSVVELRPGAMLTAQCERDDATKNNLDKIVIVGITKEGNNYFQSSANTTLGELAWMHFSFGDSLRRMIRS